MTADHLLELLDRVWWRWTRIWLGAPVAMTTAAAGPGLGSALATRGVQVEHRGSRLRRHPAPAEGEAPYAAIPVNDPARVERQLVDCLRWRRYDQAWRLLAPDCQAAWGQPSTFAELMRTRDDGARLASIQVREVHILPRWSDPETRRTHRDVAELAVDYVIILGAGRRRVVRQDVHLLPLDGGWRSLCYPSR
ncbi:MAG TPA: hypothetical protein VMW47_13865 [Verrucomicrobiae bacterium]|nr:hypothetical protein [Verrucomicrobiae bacterium]